MREETKLTIEEELQLFKKDSKSVLEAMKSTCLELKKFANEMKSEIFKNLKEGNKLAKDSYQRVLKHEEFLNEIKKNTDNCEDTLLNVLLAIRQNEYLQAWYPAQSGFPEMKVIGKHPLKDKLKYKEKAI